MNWNGWDDFFAMGGYGLYVWGAFGMCALVVAVEALQLRATRRGLRVGRQAQIDAAGERS
ncbi:heme exporter protein CcmD [Variovorax sp. KK3]|uniref:heme exporter protein CcmD n=1 Tax=Variovorax sp. KK3 TaxID=1855728 RepID=UPI00097C7CDB|nr:heme exporter protein CcmD [Variovorax sp. KK3]